MSSPGKRVALFGFGAVTAIVASMCGIGGGLFAVPLLHYVFRLPLKRSVGTSLMLVCGTATASTVVEALRADSGLHWGVVGVLVAGSLVGAQLGFAAARRIDATMLKVVFVFVLFGVGLRILLADSSGSNEEVGEVRVPVTALEYGWVALSGVLAGFVAPLLGIGGGLVAVPALFLGVEGLGYLGARACSLAMGAVNGLRGGFLHARDGNIELGAGLWLASGALVGAGVGVWAVHLPGLEYYAQVMMGTILGVVSVRFAVDVWRARRVG